jgi:mono/diheme cytochrome c family protein
MSQRFIASFATEEDLLAAVAAYRELGLEVEDAFTPYAVHGLDDAAGMKRSRLGQVCALLGLSAAALALWFQHWVSAVDWPLVIGGKPLSSIPAFIPVTFEVGVLAAGIGSLIAFFIVSRLYPGKRPVLDAPGITDDRFVLVVTSSERYYPETELKQLAAAHHAVDSRADREPSRAPGRPIDGGESTVAWGRINVLLVILLGLVVAANFGIRSRASHRGVEFLPEMVTPVAAETFASSSALRGERALQSPPEGTLPRGTTPFRLAPGPEGSELARALVSPFAEPDEEELTRGTEVFTNYCLLCHGGGGLGDGLVAKRGFPTPPSLLAPHARELTDGQIFHLITVGQGNMPAHAGQLDPLDRWRAVLKVRELQAATPPVEVTEPVDADPVAAQPVEEVEP